MIEFVSAFIYQNHTTKLQRKHAAKTKLVVCEKYVDLVCAQMCWLIRMVEFAFMWRNIKYISYLKLSSPSEADMAVTCSDYFNL